MASYEITVETGDMEGAGTNADVYITLYGEDGTAGPIRLNDGRDNFERDDVDRFKLDLARIGRLDCVHIAHDNGGARPGWFLNRVVVDDGRETVDFPAYRWLSTEENDGQTEVTLTRPRG
ncbi:PLAT/LH2 domain-containing protein [Actinomadura gamaensis]|uniref:PLAT/LH2 domain-containing protein n=1 Tax=Actinomadura gamaensis TaxID=1763541 RepID=A0ABV9U348_9ACTN